MRHFAAPRFWQHYRTLPPEIQRRADEAFKLLKRDPRHPSLQLQKKGRGWAVRVTPGCRALAKERAEGLNRAQRLGIDSEAAPLGFALQPGNQFFAFGDGRSTAVLLAGAVGVDDGYFSERLSPAV